MPFFPFLSRFFPSVFIFLIDYSYLFVSFPEIINRVMDDEEEGEGEGERGLGAEREIAEVGMKRRRIEGVKE